MKTIMQYLLIAIMAFGLTACGTTGGTSGTTSSGGTGTNGDVSGKGLSDKDLLSIKRVHFKFDSSEIDERSRRIIEAHANHLADKTVRIRLEGHGDERGTREYNLALGERRAQAVARVLRALGVKNSRVKKVSYGEEKPIDTGHNDAAWDKNRRVEIMY